MLSDLHARLVAEVQRRLEVARRAFTMTNVGGSRHWRSELMILNEAIAFVEANDPRYLCKRRGHHSAALWHRRRGRFWARRDEFWCVDCGQPVTPSPPIRAGTRALYGNGS